jgi:ADP-heptose:LPS heptosyltransferase
LNEQTVLDVSGKRVDSGDTPGVESQRNPQALVIRYGAFGDMIQTTCVYPYLSKHYEVTMNCDERGMQIIENNPHIKYILPHKAHSIENRKRLRLQCQVKRYGS